MKYSQINDLNEPVLFEYLLESSPDEIKQIFIERPDLEIEYSRDRAIDMSTLSEEEFFSSEKIILGWHFLTEFPIEDAIYLSLSDVWNAYRTGEFEQIFQSINITKEDRVIVLCREGSSSSFVAYMMQTKGFDAYFGTIHSINNPAFISGITDKDRAIVVDMLRDTDEDVFLLTFGLDEAFYLNNFPELMHESRLNPNIRPIKTGRESLISFIEQYPYLRHAKISDITEGSTLLCLSPLHCLLTKHLIDELDIGLKKIYVPKEYSKRIKEIINSKD